MKNKIYKFLVPILKKVVNNKKTQKKVRTVSKKYLGNHLGKYFIGILSTVLISSGLLLPNVTTEHIKQYTEPVTNILENPVILNGAPIEQIPEDVVMGNEYVPSINIPDWKEVKDNIEYTRTRKQNRGTCTKEAEDMLAIRSLQHLGFTPVDNGDQTLIDINYTYWNKDFQPKVDSGDIPSRSYKKFRSEGYPLAINKQFSRKNKLQGSFSNWEKGIIQGTNLYPKLIAPYRKEVSGWGADNLFRALENWQGKDYVVRMSIKNLKERGTGKRCNNFYFSETPKTSITKNCYVTGGHAIVGYDEVGIFMFMGKPSILLRTSTGSKYKRIVSVDFFREINTSWEIYTPDLIKKDNPISIKPLVVKSDYKILSTTKIKYGDRGEKVKALQRYLKVKVDGIFGNGTRFALRNWQYEHFGKWYSGKYWWTGSIKQYKKVTSQ